MNTNLDSVVAYLDRLLATADTPDYPNALNGLQVAGPREVTRVAAAVDASEAVIRDAVAASADLLLVHHGLFWDGLRPLVGRYFRRVEALVRGGVALYSSHLPLDLHPTLGNGILMARSLGLEELVPFGEARGVKVGWRGVVPPESRASFQARIAAAVDGPVRLIPGGPEEIRSVAVVTGGGGDLVVEAGETGVDAFVTGEGAHHTHALSLEWGVNLYYAGHYATETAGVKALARRLEERFGLPWVFLDHPSGL